MKGLVNSVKNVTPFTDVNKIINSKRNAYLVAMKG